MFGSKLDVTEYLLHKEFDFAKVDCRNMSTRLYTTTVERQLILLCWRVKEVGLAETHF